MDHHTNPLPFLVRLRAVQRLAIAVMCGLLVLAVPPEEVWLRTRILIAWNIGAWTYLLLAGLVVMGANAAMTRQRVQTQDQSGYVIFLMVTSAAAASFVAIGILMSGVKEMPFWPRMWHLGLSIAALISSWLLVHLLFAFHYARQYYATRRGDQDAPALSFPGGQAPDYLDFAYFSYVVGMTSQVSDVSVNSRSMRRLTLTHGVLAFLFNIAILAMSINIIASIL